MYALFLLVLPLLGFAVGQDDGSGGCESGSVTGNRCCDGDVITSDGVGIDTSDITNLICCVGGSGSDFNFGGTSCAAGQTSVPFSELSTVAGASQGTTVIVSNDNTFTQGMTVTDTVETSAMSPSTSEEISDTMTSSAMAGTQSQSAEKSATDTSTGAAVLMTSGPMAGALVLAGGLVMAAL